jgi:hypothetical protein
MLSGAILGALIGIWQGGLFDPPVRGNRPPEMSKTCLSRTSYELHPLVQICPFGRAGFSERESNEMSIDEKLDILQGCFGHEIHSFPPPPRLG